MRRKGLRRFFVIVFGLSWGLGALYALFPKQLVAIFGPVSGANPVFLVAVWAPTLTAILLSAVLGGRAGLRDLFGRLTRWRVNWRWYAAATFGIAALGLVPQLLAAQFAGAAQPDFAFGHWQAWIAAGALGFVVDPGPLGEELGWRGFALPRMEQRWSGLASALILGAIWGTWHLPAFFIPGLPQNTFPLWAFMAEVVSLSVLVTWMVNNAGGSVIIAILAHWASNRFESLAPATAPYTAAAFALAALTVMWMAGPSLGAAKMPPPMAEPDEETGTETPTRRRNA